MHKFFPAILVFSILALTGCQSSGNISQHVVNQTTGVADLFKSATDKSTNRTSEDTVRSSSEETSNVIVEDMKTDPDCIDIDLTVLSSNMVYSEVFNMVYMPDEYIGKKVKMAGSFIRYHDDENDHDYFACIIKDATQCCAQGIEFIPTEDYSYPDDFPDEGENICVIGIFEKYTEEDGYYLTLKDAILVDISE